MATEPVDIQSPQYSFGCVQYLYTKEKKNYAHVILMYRSANTMVKEYGDPRELFFSNECVDMVISKKTKVVRISFKHDEQYNRRKPIFFATKIFTYLTARYETITPYLPDIPHLLSCGNCSLADAELELNKLKLSYDRKNRIKAFNHENCKYSLRDCVLIQPSCVDFTYIRPKKTYEINLDKDKLHKEKPGGGLLYPEYYRKTGTLPSLPSDCGDPFKVGRILKVRNCNKDNIEVYVEFFYRVIDTNIDEKKISEHDIHKLYLSSQRSWIDLEDILYKCQIKFLTENEKPEVFDDIEQRKVLSFYFKEFFDVTTLKIGSLNEIQLKIENENKILYQKRKLKNIDLSDRKLKTMELFAGCGGLSEGLIQSGVADLQWAAEYEKAATDSFKANNPKTKVFHVDCNQMLKEMKEAAIDETKYSKYPRKGDVEFLCGGPPCQGYSGMNRHTKGMYSINKNRMFVNFLSFADFLRPKYVMCENVRAFVTNDKGKTIKKTIASFLAMGYQCSFGVLQAGHYGLPQVRRRVIILASDPKEVLPLYPEPLHVFLHTQLEVKIDNIIYRNNIQQIDSAPFNYTTVRNAIGDLPLNVSKVGKNYPDVKKPLTTYQEIMRRGSKKLTLHFTKNLTDIIYERIKLIPTTLGSDWRDLPNKLVKLPDGSFTQYLFYDWIYTNKKRNGNPYLTTKYNTESLHQGVCKCSIVKEFKAEKKCKQYNQDKTIIPWCLPHTSDTHNNWSGLYGRVIYDGFMSTVVTSPSPIAKQGTVIHPTEDRIVSCREYARIQGFPDSYVLEGTVKDIFKQIGNAVPPPLSKAVGVEIRKAMAKKELEFK